MQPCKWIIAVALLFGAAACKKNGYTPPNPIKKDTPKADITIAGWYNDGWEAVSHQLYMTHNTQFSEANPFWYNLGSSDAAPGKNATDGSIYERPYAFSQTEISDIHSRGDLVIPAIADNATGQINDIINNPTTRKALIDNLVNTAIARGYDGWDLDFELGIETGKAAFTSFVNDLATALKAKKSTLVLDVTIGAFSSEEEESYWLFDLAALKGSKARWFKIMAYDQFLGKNGVAGPIADINWVTACLNYMVVKRGLPANRVLLGIANYARVYRKNDDGNYAVIPEFKSYEFIQQQASSVLTFDNNTKESVATWTDATGIYRAYYCDQKSVAPRLELVKSFGLAGACFWVLGKEDPAIYTTLKEKFPQDR